VPPGLKELVELYGGGPLAAIIGTLVLAVFALAAALRRSWADHRADLRETLPLTAKLVANIERQEARWSRVSTPPQSNSRATGGNNG
jgi:hypothetical protein